MTAAPCAFSLASSSLKVAAPIDIARFELPTRCGVTTPVVAERQISQRVAQSSAPDSGGAAGEVSGI